MKLEVGEGAADEPVVVYTNHATCLKNERCCALFGLKFRGEGGGNRAEEHDGD